MQRPEHRPGCLLSVDLEARFQAPLAGVHPQPIATPACVIDQPVDRLSELTDRTGSRVTSLPAGGAFLRLLTGRWIRSPLQPERRRGGASHLQLRRHLHPRELQPFANTGLGPLRRGLLCAGSRSLLRELSGIPERFRAVAIEDPWHELVADGPGEEPALGAVGSA